MKPDKKKNSLFQRLGEKLGGKRSGDSEGRMEDSGKPKAAPAPHQGNAKPQMVWEDEVTVADPYQLRSHPIPREKPEDLYPREEVQRSPRKPADFEQQPTPVRVPDRPRREDLSRDQDRVTGFIRWEEAPKKAPKPEVKVQEEPQDSGDVTVFDRHEVKPVELDKTVYERSDDLDDVTVFGPSDDFDEDEADKTVRGSFRNFALLVHPAENRVYPLRLPQTKLGRSPIKCDVAIEGNDSISKLHAEIIQISRKCYLRDINSSNGTYLYGEKLGSEQKELSEVATFQLSDETLVLISGYKARQIFNLGTVDILMNEAIPEACALCGDFVLLNRSSQWPGGTLNDKRIHRHGHARVNPEKDGIYLVDETPQETNGTFLNGSRLRRGESRKLKNGDCIRVGETTLVFKTIEI